MNLKNIGPESGLLMLWQKNRIVDNDKLKTMKNHENNDNTWKKKHKNTFQNHENQHKIVKKKI